MSEALAGWSVAPAAIVPGAVLMVLRSERLNTPKVVIFNALAVCTFAAAAVLLCAFELSVLCVRFASLLAGSLIVKVVFDALTVVNTEIGTRFVETAGIVFAAVTVCMIEVVVVLVVAVVVVVFVVVVVVVDVVVVFVAVDVVVVEVFIQTLIDGFD